MKANREEMQQKPGADENTNAGTGSDVFAQITSTAVPIEKNKNNDIQSYRNTSLNMTLRKWFCLMLMWTLW